MKHKTCTSTAFGIALGAIVVATLAPTAPVDARGWGYGGGGFRGGGYYANDERYRGYYEGPRGGEAYRGPHGGGAYRGPYGGGAVRTPYGGTAVRGPAGNVFVGTRYYAPPAAAVPFEIGGTTYYMAGGVCYEQAFDGSNVVYVVVPTSQCG